VARSALGSVVAFLILCGPALANGGSGIAGLYRSEEGQGVSATAQIGFSRPDPNLARVRRSEAASSVHEGAVAAPVPVAVSAHNCVPRLDPRGVSLTFEFSESGVSDCISFVSPEPIEPQRQQRRRNHRPPDPEALALEAFDRMIALAPEPELRVSPATIGLTGLPSYFWVDNRPSFLRARASAGPVGIMAEARATSYLWDFGDGATRATRHPGRPWTSAQKGNVGHLYETKGRYETTVEIVWAARWRLNGGPWRDLGYFSTADSERYAVREIVGMLVRRALGRTAP
jgi:hypothetical protein